MKFFTGGSELFSPFILDVMNLNGKFLSKSSEDSRDRAGEVDSSEVRVAGDDLAEHGAVTGQEVDETVREASLLEYLVDQVVGEDGRVARLPQCHVALAK